MGKSKEEFNENNFYLAKWLGGELSDEALKKHVSENDISAYKKLKAGLKLYVGLDAPIETSFLKIKKRINNKKKKVRQPYWQIGISAAAVIAILFAISSIVSTNKISYNTEYAEHKNIILPDTSEVILNAKSKLVYSKETWNDNREVYLKGEAYFKVKTGSHFTVKTDTGSVLVLGTQFNIIAYDDYFQVSCYEGKVQVNSNSESLVLTPMQSTRKINKNTQENWTFQGSEPTWVSGETTFRSVPLSYVITALEHQYGILFDKSKIDDSIIFTGSFIHSDLNLALTTVFKTMQISYKKKKNKIIELSM